MDTSRIRELRKTKKISQKELGEMIGISASTIGMYEQGRRDPDTKTLLTLAKVLDVSVDYLIMASDVVGQFDIDKIAHDVAQNLMDNDSLMFNASCYTTTELISLTNVIENSVKMALNKHIKD